MGRVVQKSVEELRANTEKARNVKKGITIYMHFSFRRPKNENYAVFAVTCYKDLEFKQLITKNITSDILWKPESQHINSIQSYYKALEYIFNNQGDMLRNNITNVVLVSANSSLVNWIMGRGRNTGYIKYVDNISAPFRFGAPKELLVGVGLMEAVDHEKSKQYCKPERADNLQETLSKLHSNENKVYALDVHKAPKEEIRPGRKSLHREKPEIKIRTIFDVMQEEAPKIEDGMKEIQ